VGPSAPLEIVLAARPPEQRAIHEAVIGALAGLGPIAALAGVGQIIIEPVGTSMMIKRTRTFAEVIFKRDVVEIAFLRSRGVESPRIVRMLQLSANRTAHVVRADDPAAVDEELCTWLTEAWASSPI
jgi:hypothetical protein